MCLRELGIRDRARVVRALGRDHPQGGVLLLGRSIGRGAVLRRLGPLDRVGDLLVVKGKDPADGDVLARLGTTPPGARTW